MTAVRRLTLSAVRRPSSSQLKLLGALSMLVALGCWAFASPVGASPDENYHIASVWCAHGTSEGVCEPGATAETRKVPSQFPLDIVCFAGLPEKSAACQSAIPASGELVETERGNFIGAYPPVFYWFAGLFVGDAVDSSVLTMRLINATLFVALVLAVYLLVPPGLRRALVGGALVTAVPLGVFLVPSINPSGWGILSATTFLVCLLGYLTVEDRRRRIGLGALAALSLLIGAGARSDAAIYAGVAIVAALILTARTQAHTVRRLAYPAVLGVVAVLAFLSAGQSSVADPETGAQRFSIPRLVRTAIDIPALWIGGMGGAAPQRDFSAGGPWGLGWLDTAMPAVVWVGMWGVFVAVLFLAVAGAGRRRGLAVGAVALAAFVIPTYIQYLTASPVGGLIQPRYVLPLLTLLAATAMVRLDGEAFRLTSGHRWIIATVLIVANTTALFTNLRRYVTGNDVNSWNLDRDAEWWWSIPVSPLTVWALGSLAFGIGVILLTSEFTVRAAAAGETNEDVAELAAGERRAPAVDEAREGDGRAGDHMPRTGPRHAARSGQTGHRTVSGLT